MPPSISAATMRDIDGVLYCNDGDWVESLTALVEHADGRLEIVDWAERMAAAAPGRDIALHPALAALRSMRSQCDPAAAGDASMTIRCQRSISSAT